MDYTALTEELIFNLGGPNRQCVNITILDDTVVESSIEFFTVETTSTLSPGTQLNLAIIIDDDGK